MKIQLISDTHGRFKNIIWNKNADIILAAGDISENIDKSISFLNSSPVPVFYIAGNHEFYNSDISQTLLKIRELCDNTNGKVNFMEKESYQIDNIRLLGTTLWSNYDNFDPLLIDSSEGFINDFFNIKSGSFNSNPEWIEDLNILNHNYEKTRRTLYLQGGINKELIEKLYKERLEIFKKKKINIHDEFFLKNRFTASLVYLFNKESIYWLEEELLEPFNGKTIVMTHHAPSKLPLSLSNFVVNIHGKSLYPFIKNNIYLPKIGTYTNSLEGLINRNNISHWVHGHFHNKMNYQIGNTSIHCNPSGYKKNNSIYTGYNPYIIDTDININFINKNILHFKYILKGILNYIFFLRNTNNLKLIFNNNYTIQSLIEEINVNITPLINIKEYNSSFIKLNNPLLNIINDENNITNTQNFEIIFEDFIDYLYLLLKIIK